MHPNLLVNWNNKCFQGVIHNKLQIVWVFQMTLHFGKLLVKNTVLIVDKSANKFIITNDILTQYKCDLLNSAKAIVFNGEQVLYTLFKSTVYIFAELFALKLQLSDRMKRLLFRLYSTGTQNTSQIRFSCSNNLRKQAQYLKHALWPNTHYLWYYCLSQIFWLRLWPLKTKMLGVNKPLKQHSF